MRPPNEATRASLFVLVAKRDATVLFCIDYHKLNAMNRRNTYLIPKIDDCLDALGEVHVFTTLDVNYGYWQVPMDNKATTLTTFTNQEALSQFIRRLIELMNAPTTFHSAMDQI